MRLKIATLFAIIAITYIFIVQTIGTAFPLIGLVTIYLKITKILSLVASLVLIYFYIIFYKDYVREEQVKLKLATTFVTIIILIGMFVEIIRLLRIFDFDIFTDTEKTRYTEVIVPLAGAIILLFFYLSFYNENVFEKQLALKRATTLAIIGSSALVLLHTLVVINYFYFMEKGQPFELIGKTDVLYILGSVLIIFYFATILYFFVSFYKMQEQN